MVAPRDVIRIFDRFTRPNKPKLHLCVCDERQLFLRINSEAIFPPCHPISRADNRSFLTHDSFIELQQLVRHVADDIAQAEYLGVMSLNEARKVVAAAELAETLPDEHKQLIGEKLLAE
jgi:hypothetical protein